MYFTVKKNIFIFILFQNLKTDVGGFLKFNKGTFKRFFRFSLVFSIKDLISLQVPKNSTVFTWTPTQNIQQRMRIHSLAKDANYTFLHLEEPGIPLQIGLNLFAIVQYVMHIYKTKKNIYHPFNTNIILKDRSWVILLFHRYGSVLHAKFRFKKQFNG